MSIRFEWNSHKARRNQIKHGVSFSEAASVFQDPLAFIFDDEYHLEDEYRELIIGHSHQNRVLIVAFTERDDVIRIISARKADQDEREAYEHTKR